jgi:hypothetical protein
MRCTHPGDLFNFAAAGVERNAQDAAAAVFVERRENRFAGDDVITGNFDLFRLEQKNFWRVKKKISSDVSDDPETRSHHGPNKNIAEEGKILAGEFLAADFDRFLATQIARLIIFNELRPVRFGVGNGGVFSNGLHAFHTTTSFSS